MTEAYKIMKDVGKVDRKLLFTKSQNSKIGDVAVKSWLLNLVQLRIEPIPCLINSGKALLTIPQGNYKTK